MIEPLELDWEEVNDTINATILVSYLLDEKGARVHGLSGEPDSTCRA